MSEPTKYRTREGEMVDEIAQAFYGKTDGTTEAILEANPSLADYEVLPAGLVIILPEMPAPATVQLIGLWS